MSLARHFLYYWDLLRIMTEKELKIRYKRVSLGFLWSLFYPLSQMIVIGFIFSFFIKEPVDHYWALLLLGFLFWQFFSQSLSRATQSIVQERYLIQKKKFPYEVIPLAVVITNLIHLVIALGLVITLGSILGIVIWPAWLWLFPALGLLGAFTIGSSLLSAVLYVMYRDIHFIVQSVLMIWFYATPIVYSLQWVPQWTQNLLALNPLTGVFALVQRTVISESPISPLMLVSSVSLSLGVLGLGIYMFQKKAGKFSDLV